MKHIRHMKRTLFSLTVAAAIAAGTAALIGSHEPAVAADASRPTVVELFTSQSCYSCPPAEEYLGELANRKDLIALEYHVDYWDDLVYGRAGKWKDRFSKREYTDRQRGYAGRLPKGQVYTPQMVIDGRAFEVGSRRGAVRRTLKRVAKERSERLDVQVTPAAAGLAVSVTGEAKPGGGIWFVRFIRKQTTRVLRGENHGKTLTNFNIVTELKRIGDWAGAPVSVTLPAGLADGQGCAILVQGENHGPIKGAAACPNPSS
ncbi:MAG: DUF1223 domain-containing protein [Rhodospirillales bacterium]|nr:DUF1223 domain-containing protein [Rhodospirillales bacterium]